eukprot:CAMPEP_0202970262 /NCGR_PEP_ID=MMETSP1396-20130829/16246_1 /ASSEMBLY_ACC=CAM_ASM_000872 /TAXON_ID= /ORGANISM="Pseudokeronopsis sp., Strain Brazil" /LENGTH=147 /DNA_ID=CAMNT_0049698661 /DNA_START=62 /DNA_END=505 /DNA_ORIENTATION=-
MTRAPIKKESSLKKRFPGRENSSVMISEQDMYRKVPPAMLMNTMSTIVDRFDSNSPSATPIGVAKAKINMSQHRILKFPGKAFYSEIDSDIPSAYLCNNTEIMRSTATVAFRFSPSANPSKIEWNDIATIRMKGWKLQFLQKPLSPS